MIRTFRSRAVSLRAGVDSCVDTILQDSVRAIAPAISLAGSLAFLLALYVRVSVSRRCPSPA